MCSAVDCDAQRLRCKGKGCGSRKLDPEGAAQRGILEDEFSGGDGSDESIARTRARASTRVEDFAYLGAECVDSYRTYRRLSQTWRILVRRFVYLTLTKNALCELLRRYYAKLSKMHYGTFVFRFYRQCRQGFPSDVWARGGLSPGSNCVESDFGFR